MNEVTHIRSLFQEHKGKRKGGAGWKVSSQKIRFGNNLSEIRLGEAKLKYYRCGIAETEKADKTDEEVLEAGGTNHPFVVKKPQVQGDA